MRALITFCALAALAGIPAEGKEKNEMVTLYDKAAVDLGWQAVNDNVMGGRSRGGPSELEGRLLFAGSTNTNGGGFSSIRASFSDAAMKDADGIALSVRGDGREYSLMVRTNARYRRSLIWYRASFKTKANTWTDVRIPWSSFQPRWRGRALRGPALDRGRISGLGIMIYDKKDGPFRLEVDRIRAYATRTPFSMKAYQWKQRPVLVFAPSANDARLAKQLAEVQANLKAFAERDMALIVVLGEGKSVADGGVLTNAEVTSLRTRYKIGAEDFAVRLVGKDGWVKYRTAAPVALKTLFDLIDSMPMRQREMRTAGT